MINLSVGSLQPRWLRSIWVPWAILGCHPTLSIIQRDIHECHLHHHHAECSLSGDVYETHKFVYLSVRLQISTRTKYKSQNTNLRYSLVHCMNWEKRIGIPHVRYFKIISPPPLCVSDNLLTASRLGMAQKLPVYSHVSGTTDQCNSKLKFMQTFC